MIVGVLQARISSSRLPGKVLLPVRGYPSVVLAALRAANLGLRVVVATSDQSSDDNLSSLLRERDLAVVRGPLDDVLRRFVIATNDLPNDAIVVRLTADNLVPDGAFIAELADMLERSGLEYLGTNSPTDGLPYGLSAEAFRLSALRQADHQAGTAYDREHVTPWLRRHSVATPFRPKQLSRNLSHLRCTVDCIDDYDRIVRAFSLVEDPVMASWQELCSALERLLPDEFVSTRPPGGRVTPVPVLGTAQLGLPSYGRTNSVGRPGRTVAVGLVRTAVHHGILWLDTARDYEHAESVVGEALKPYGDRVTVVTKLSTLTSLAQDSRTNLVNAAVDASVFRSCWELGVSSLPVALLHSWAHRRSHEGRVWDRMLKLRDQGVIGQLGASVYCPVQAREALTDPEIQHLQLPFNVLDHRWHREGIDELARQRPEVVIHARSVFLQGLLAGRAEDWPAVDGIDPTEVIGRLEELAHALDRGSRADLCLAYGRSQDWIHGLVVGIETVAQLRELLTLFRRPLLSLDQQAAIRSTFSSLPDTILNPALWPAQ